MKNEMLISVIVPCYNIEKYIENTVKSILAQTYTNLEVILVNDGSTDDTLPILVHLKSTDTRIRVIDKENGGVTSARLRGVKEAAGEIIAFVDGDDELEPDMYERLVKNLTENNADISHCGFQRITKLKTTYYYDTGKYEVLNKKDGLIALLTGNYIEPSLCNKLFRKHLFDCILSVDNKIDLSIKLTEDLLVNYHLFSAAEKTVYEDFCGYKYLVRENSSSNRKLNIHRLIDPMRVTQILLQETQYDNDLNAIIRRKYVRELISLSTIPVTANKELVAPIHKQRLHELRKNLFSFVKDSGIDKKLKLMAIVTAFSPALYRKIHSVYMKRTGLDKIYD